MIEIENFSGFAKAVDPRKLNTEMATHCVNARFDTKQLTPWKSPRVESVGIVGADHNYGFRYNQKWYFSTHRRSFVKRLFAEDKYNRIIYTDPTSYPKVQSGDAVYALGIPTPGMLMAEATTPGDMSSLLNVETRIYVVTFVDAWGAEGPPSMPSAAVTVGLNSVVRLTLPQIPAGPYNFSSGARKRIYRLNAGTSGSSFQYVSEVVHTATTFEDRVKSSDLQELLPSATWNSPPDNNGTMFPDGPLLGLCAMQGGFFAGYSGNTLYFSEIGLPHAWPQRRTIPIDITGILSLGSGLFVGTKERPYIVDGTSPDSVVARPLDAQQACLGEDTMVDMGGYALYASPDGLCAYENGQIAVVSETFFTREQWQQLKPASIRAFRYENKYVAVITDTTARTQVGATGFIYDPQGDTAAFTFFDFPIRNGWWDETVDKAYVLMGTDLCVFNEGPERPLIWVSKIFRLARPTTLRCVKAIADSYPFVLTVKSRGQTLYSVVINDDQPRALPGRFKTDEYQIEISGTAKVSRVGLYQSFSEAV